MAYKLGKWSLTDLFPSPDSDEMRAAFETIENKVLEFESFRDKLDPQMDVEDFMTALEQQKSISLLSSRIRQYSGLWFARALPQNGEIIMTDFNDQYKAQAEENFNKANQDISINFMVGDALKLMDEIKGPFDIIFNDVDKEFYPQIIEPAYSLLRQGGLFITDNTLWYGKVTKNGRNWES